MGIGAFEITERPSKFPGFLHSSLGTIPTRHVTRCRKSNGSIAFRTSTTTTFSEVNIRRSTFNVQRPSSTALFSTALCETKIESNPIQSKRNTLTITITKQQMDKSLSRQREDDIMQALSLEPILAHGWHGCQWNRWQRLTSCWWS